MFWLNDDEGEDSMSYRAQDILAKIRQIKRKDMISIAEGQELAKLERELEDLRKMCSHNYEVMLLFHRHRRFCRWCDLEDHTYKHQG